MLTRHGSHAMWQTGAFVPAKRFTFTACGCTPSRNAATGEFHSQIKSGSEKVRVTIYGACANKKSICRTVRSLVTKRSPTQLCNRCSERKHNSLCSKKEAERQRVKCAREILQSAGESAAPAD